MSTEPISYREFATTLTLGTEVQEQDDRIMDMYTKYLENKESVSKQMYETFSNRFLVIQNTMQKLEKELGIVKFGGTQ